MSTVPPVQPFDAWVLPRGTGLPEGSRGVHDMEGVRVGSLPPDAVWIRRLTAALRGAKVALGSRSALEIAQALGAVGERFLDPEDPVRTKALELLPATSGLSPEMAAAVLDGMAADWTGAKLSRLLQVDLGGGSVVDGFVDAPHGRVQAVGPNLCLQVVSGSVPGVGVTALVRSLLVKGPTLLKPGLGDVVLPVLFGQVLHEVDSTLADALAVVYWPGGSEAVEDVALQEADVTTVYGGDGVVRELGARAPVTARFVAYHHRLSLGVVGREALGPDLVHRTASEVAGAVAFFDQRGCVSPHVVYVEEGGAAVALAFTEELAEALATVETHLPGGRLDPLEASELQQVRGAAELMAATGAGTEVRHGGDASWTVILDPEASFVPSCGARVVRVKPVDDVLRVPGIVEPLGHHLQTVGVAGAGDRIETLGEAFGRVGATRITGFADVPFPHPWWHHDGTGPLQALVRWVDLEV
jgi:hypothetical protein